MSEKPSIVSVLEHYGTRGHGGRRTQMVACPFHEDRTPSCSIDTDRELFNCHSCGRQGDSFNLIMEKEGTGFVGAKKFAEGLGLKASEAEEEEAPRWGRLPVRRDGRKPSGGGYVPAWRRGS